MLVKLSRFVEDSKKMHFRGTTPMSSLCSFEVVTDEPLLVIRDIFGSFVGESCRCPTLEEEDIKLCTGSTKKDCCDNYNGQTECDCSSNKSFVSFICFRIATFCFRCQYQRISDKPLVWQHHLLASLKCKCK